MGIDIGLIKWDDFSIAFLDMFFLLELMESKV